MLLPRRFSSLLKNAFKLGTVAAVSYFLISFLSGSNEKLIQRLPSFELLPKWHTFGEFFVYSAFVDRCDNYRNNEAISIRSLAIFLSNTSVSNHTIFCHIYNDEHFLLSTSSAKLEISPDYMTYKYSSAFIICPIPLKATEFWNTSKYYFLSFSSFQDGGEFKEKLLIETCQSSENEEYTNFDYKFGICVQPTYNYDDVLSFLEWITFHSLLGVSHITLYNISIGPRIDCILKHFHNQITTKDNSINITMLLLPWTLPFSGKDIHMNAQRVQGVDCIFRSRLFRITHALFLDFDEFLVTNYRQGIYNYHQLISKINKNLTNGELKHAQLLFRSVFFGHNIGVQMPTANRKARKKFIPTERLEFTDLEIFWRTERQKEFYAFKERSKFISRPNFVIDPGIHTLSQGLGKELQVDEKLAHVHHYRDYKCGFQGCPSKERVEDNSTHYFVPRVFEGIKSILSEIKVGRVCGFNITEIRETV